MKQTNISWLTRYTRAVQLAQGVWEYSWWRSKLDVHLCVVRRECWRYMEWWRYIEWWRWRWLSYCFRTHLRMGMTSAKIKKFSGVAIISDFSEVLWVLLMNTCVWWCPRWLPFLICIPTISFLYFPHCLNNSFLCMFIPPWVNDLKCVSCIAESDCIPDQMIVTNINYWCFFFVILLIDYAPRLCGFPMSSDFYHFLECSTFHNSLITHRWFWLSHTNRRHKK